jgi:hypothetical protein
VSTQALEEYRQRVEAAREETRRVKQTEQTEIDRGIDHFINNLLFPYHFKADRKPFYVHAIYHDEKFTYIRARPRETPVIYEIADGQPNLINFDYSDGLYTVHKVLDRGYLAIGKAKLYFTRVE